MVAPEILNLFVERGVVLNYRNFFELELVFYVPDEVGV